MRKSLFFILIFITSFLSCKKTIEPVSNEACAEVSVLGSQFLPLDTLFLEIESISAPTELKAVFLNDGEDSGLFMKVEENKEGKPYLLAPFHPSSPLKGGFLQVQFQQDGLTKTCKSSTIEIKSLPSSPGYTEKTFTFLNHLILLQAQNAGLSEKELNFENGVLTDRSVPFLILNTLLNGSGDGSVKKILENEALVTDQSLDFQTSLEFADGVLSHLGILEVIEADIKSLESPNARRAFGILRDLKANCSGVDAADVAKEMRIVQDALLYLNPNSEKARRIQKGSDAAMYTGIAPPLGTASALMGSLIWAYSKSYEAISNTYFSKFTAFDFDLPEQNFLEEAACDPFRYENISFTAATNGWKASRSVAEGLINIAGVLASKVGWKDIAIANTSLGASSAFTSAQLNKLGNEGYYDGESFVVNARVCENIAANDSKYVYGKIIGEAFSLDQENRLITPVKAGEADLEVGLRSSYFAGNTLKEIRQLKISPVQVNTSPSGIIRVTPGDEIDIKAVLTNALSPHVKATSDEGATLKKEFIESQTPFSGSQKFLHLSPEDESKYPYQVLFEHESDYCLRNKPNAEPRIAIVTIQAGGTLEVVTDDIGCLSPGEIRQFEAIVQAGEKQVVWSAFDESGASVFISNTGLFEAPSKTGGYSIVATSLSDPSLADTALVEVGNCSCTWSFSGGGIVDLGNNSTFTVFPQANLAVFSFQSDGDGLITLQFPSGYLPEDDTKTSFQLLQNESKDPKTAWLLSTSIGNELIVAPAGYDSDDKPSPGAVNLTISMKRNGSNISGLVTGQAVKTNIQSGLESILSVELKFEASLYDPENGFLGCD